MFQRRTRLTLLLLFILGFLTTQSVQAKQGFGLNWNSMQDLIDHIMCDYNMDISESQLTTWMEGLISGSGDCDEINEVWTTESSQYSESYRWRPVSNATGYTVSSLGLRDGTRTKKKVTQPKHDFHSLTLQPYIFAFITDCITGAGTSAHIIIVDKDLFFTSNTNGNCFCPSIDMNLTEDLSCTGNYNINVYNFDWVSAETALKYKFNLNGTVDGMSRNKEFWAIKGYSEMQEGQAVKLLDCDAYYDHGGCEGCASLGDDDFNVNFSQAGIHVYIMNPDLEVSSITASVCGNDSNKTKGKAKAKGKMQLANTDISITPNPMLEQYQLNISAVKEQSGKLDIFNAQGQKVTTKDLNLLKGNNRFDHSMENLPGGVYYFNIQTEDNQTTKRVFKL